MHLESIGGASVTSCLSEHGEIPVPAAVVCVSSLAIHDGLLEVIRPAVREARFAF